MSQRQILDPTLAATTLAADARHFYEQGWMLGTSGNLSIATQANPFQCLVTASGVHKGRINPEALITVDLNGQPTTESSRRPSAETLIHCAIYRQTNAGAVYHVHHLHAALASVLDEANGAVVIDNVEMLKGIGVPNDGTLSIPIVENNPDIPALASDIEARLHDLSAPVVLIARHGIYTWGETPADALRHVEILAYLFAYRVGLHQLGL